jgi:hypothetical protein
MKKKYFLISLLILWFIAIVGLEKCTAQQNGTFKNLYVDTIQPVFPSNNHALNFTNKIQPWNLYFNDTLAYDWIFKHSDHGGGVIDTTKLVTKYGLNNGLTSPSSFNTLLFNNFEFLADIYDPLNINNRNRLSVGSTNISLSSNVVQYIIDSTGMHAIGNYSFQNSFNPRWIPDKNYVDSVVSNGSFLHLSGGTLTGAVLFNRNTTKLSTNARSIQDKNYIDSTNYFSATKLTGSHPQYKIKIKSSNNVLDFNSIGAKTSNSGELKIDSTGVIMQFNSGSSTIQASRNNLTNSPAVILGVTSLLGAGQTVVLDSTGFTYGIRQTSHNTLWIPDKFYVDSVSGGPVISVSATATNLGVITPNNASTTLTAHVNNDVGAVTYEWDAPNGSVVSLTQSVTVSTIGVYTCFAIDQSGRFAKSQISVYSSTQGNTNVEQSFTKSGGPNLQAGTYIPDSIITLRINGSGTYFVTYSYNIVSTGATFATLGYFESGLYQKDSPGTFYAFSIYLGSIPIITTETTPTGMALTHVEKSCYVVVTSSSLRVTCWSRLNTLPSVGTVSVVGININAIRLY